MPETVPPLQGTELPETVLPAQVQLLLNLLMLVRSGLSPRPPGLSDRSLPPGSLLSGLPDRTLPLTGLTVLPGLCRLTILTDRSRRLTLLLRRTDRPDRADQNLPRPDLPGPLPRLTVPV